MNQFTIGKYKNTGSFVSKKKPKIKLYKNDLIEFRKSLKKESDKKTMVESIGRQ